MQNKTKYWIAGGGAGALLAAAAAAVALAPHRHGVDLDGDGRIVAAEIEQAARQLFAEHDADRDGRLTGEEVPRRHGRHRGDRHHGDDGLAQFAPPAPAVPAQPAAPGGPATNPPDAPPSPPAATLPLPGRPPIDADGDGAVSFAEFRAGFAVRLARADANRDGTISEDVLEAARRRRGRRH